MLRRSIDRWVLLALALHALILAVALALPAAVTVLLVGFAMQWASNTVSHIHLHTPVFRSAGANRALSYVLTMQLAVPQTLWRHRHLRHHAREPDRVPRLGRSGRTKVAVEVGSIIAFGGVLTALGVGLEWLSGSALGYALCALQGRMEHQGGASDGLSSYGPWHNRLWFNDGHHAEHHRLPGVHWSELPARRLLCARTSAHAPLGRALRALRPALLGWLERVLLWVAPLRRAVLRAHVRATRRVLGELEPRRVLVVGGGLYPRTALVMAAVRPTARCVLLDTEVAHLAIARRFLARHAPRLQVELRTAFWTPGGDDTDVDLVTLPLALRGHRFARSASVRLVHAWLWERGPRAPGVRSVRVAWWLLKRVVLVPAAT